MGLDILIYYRGKPDDKGFIIMGDIGDMLPATAGSRKSFSQPGDLIFICSAYIVSFYFFLVK